jgi:hypothetical protein
VRNRTCVKPLRAATGLVVPVVLVRHKVRPTVSAVKCNTASRGSGCTCIFGLGKRSVLHRALKLLYLPLLDVNLCFVLLFCFSGARQLISQGTTDIVLDSCADCWSGNDLEPLTEELRKKILDFYQVRWGNAAAYVYSRVARE